MKAAIYCRLSEEDKNKQSQTDDSNSIQNQKSMLLQYAMDHDWEVYNIYSDDDYTGADRNRPEFKKLLADAEAKKFDIILCKTQSRFTRELELVEKYIHGLFPIWGIRFIGVVDNADTDNKGNKKSRQINGLVNEWYLEDMSDNIKSVLINKRKNGRFIGAFAPYGYQKDPNEKGHLIIDPDAAEVVQEIFRLYAQGYGKMPIAKILNSRGIPNPTRYKQLKGLNYKQAETKKGTLWKDHTVSYVLSNQVYIGNLVQGKVESESYKTKRKKARKKEDWYVVEGTHEPIISQELWDQVQMLRNSSGKPLKSGKLGLFAKKVRCAECGYILRSNYDHKRNRRYLQCPTHQVAKNVCHGASISVERLERYVLQELRKIAEEYLDQEEAEQKLQFCNHLQEEKEKKLQEKLNYEKKEKEYADGLKELYLDKMKGILTEQDFIELSRSFSKEREHLAILIRENEQKIELIDKKMQTGENRRELIEKYANLEHLNREIVTTLIDYIVVGKRIPKSYDVPIEIHWNF